ncbi:MAG: general secretion pathway protein GspD [Betaproteobacteria bacterium]|nr:MAG: general secretion pathway protein GspD [Betaproteobacteria bacterium]
MLASCAGWEAQRQGSDLAADATQLAAEGRIEESLAKLHEAIRLDPTRMEYRIAYQTTRERAIAAWLAAADRAKSTGQPADAEQLYNRVLGVDPGNARARAGLDEFRRDRRDAQLLRQAQLAFEKGDSDTALELLRDILTGNPRHRAAADLRRTIETKLASAPAYPKLDAALRKPITIEFRDTPLRQIMEVFSRTSGVNFVFDRDVRPDLRATVFLRNTSVRDAMAMVLLTNQLEYRVLDAASVVIYPNTPAKAREYKELTVRTFFLDHGDVKAAATTLRTILKTRDLIVDEKQNMIIMRDTPEAVRLAEKLIALHDLPEPEVMLEVEILEVTRTRLLQLGVQWPSQMTLTPLSTTGGTQLTVDDLRNLNSSSIGVQVGPAIINLNKQDGDLNLLANPRIRTKNREKARILVGERVPNITTTATATGFVSESVTYVDVGLKLEVEPTVSMNDEIAIKVGLEVSNIVQQIQTRSGSLAYQIGTRNATTVLRLKEGENQVLAGLINDIDRNTGNKIPALGDIPILGRLFGAERDEGLKTEIVLSITPRIVRNASRPSLGESEFHAGTETRLGDRGTPISPKPALPAFKPAIKPAAPGPGAAPGASPQPSAAPGPGAGTATGADPTVGVPMGTVGGSVGGPGAIVTAGATSFAFRGPAQAAAGASFDLVLSVTPDEPITSIPFSIGYDPKLIEITAVNEGDFMRQGGAASSFTTKIDTSTGRVFGTATRGSGDGASQTGALLTLSVRTLTANTSATVQLVATSPIGVGGRSVAIQTPAPYQLTITP